MPNGSLQNWIFGSIWTALLAAIGWLMKRHFDDDLERHRAAEKAIEEIRRLVIEFMKR